MSLLEPDSTYTIFLLPFAYHPTQREETTVHPRYAWEEMSWGQPIAPKDAEIRKKARELRKKRGESGKDEDITPADMLNAERVLRSEADDSQLAWRLQYFLPESNMILFDRAKWFELRRAKNIESTEPETRPLKFPWVLKLHDKEGEDIKLRVHWTKLVLFEWADSDDRKTLDRLAFARNGILAIKVGFEEDPKPCMRHLLLLNEAFRYYRLPFLAHPDVSFKRHEIIEGLPGTKEDENLCLSYHAMWEELLSYPLSIGGRLIDLFPGDWKLGAKKQAMATADGQAVPSAHELLKSPLNAANNKAGGTWDVYPDNRAFVWTCADLEHIPADSPFRALVEEAPQVGSPTQFWIETWHALLDVDAGCDRVDPYRYEWLRKRTYTRWACKQTLYGFNNFSVALMGHLYTPTVSHFERMYLDMGLLLLQIRTSLFRVSQRISADTRDRLRPEDNQNWDELFRRFHDDFAAFVNLYQFPLLSTQQEGIEIYESMRKWMDVDELFKEVQSEIEATHQLTEMVAEKSAQKASEKTQSLLNVLAIVGALIGGIALGGQMLGSNDLWATFSGHFDRFWMQTGIAALLGVVMLVAGYQFKRFMDRRDHSVGQKKGDSK